MPVGFRQFKRSFAMQFGLASSVVGFTGNPLFRLDNIEGNGLRVAFDVERKNTGDPDRCTLRVWNLSPNTRKQIRQDLQARRLARSDAFKLPDAAARGAVLKAIAKTFEVRIFAGYGKVPGLLFKGDILEVRERVRVSFTDVVTEIELGDGVLGIIDGYISQTLGVTATVQQILAAASSAQGTPLAPDALAIANAFAASGDVVVNQYRTAAVAKPRDIIDEIADLLGLQWFVIDGQIKMAPVGQALADFSVGLQDGVDLLDFTSENDANDVQGRCNLNGLIVPGRGLALFDRKGKRLKAQGHTTGYVRHVGDTHGADWYSAFHATKAALPIPPTEAEIFALG